MKVAVIGTGYVGLVTGACLADIGHHVICVDIDAEKIAKLKKGMVPIFEPGLSEVVVRNLRAGRLDFTVDAKKAIQASEIVMSAVGTPPGENHAADLKYVKQVARDFGAYINGPKLFVIKSTVPVGTSEEVALEIRRAMGSVIASTHGAHARSEAECVPNKPFAKQIPYIKRSASSLQKRRKETLAYGSCLDKAIGVRAPVTMRLRPEALEGLSKGNKGNSSDVMVRQACPERSRRAHHDIPFDVVSNPEFLREGSAVKDFMAPDRIIVGINGWGKTASDVSSSTRNFPKGNFKFCCFRRESTVSSSTARTSLREVRLETTIREANTFSPQATAPDRGSLSTVSLNIPLPLDARAIMTKLYEPIVRVGSPLVFTDIRSAEIIKYASNAFLATKISFINEIANFCDIVGGDVKEVAKGIGMDHRIGPHFLRAGVGYGGSCLPKDVRTLIELGRKTGNRFRILEAVEAVNMDQRKRLVAKVRRALGGKLQGKTIAIWGLAFKPNTDDIRSAPSITIIERLLAEGAKIQAYDPVALPNAKKIFEQMQKDYAKKSIAKQRKSSLLYAKNPYDAAKGAHALMLLTEWDEFKNPDRKRLQKLMKGTVIIDGRNLLR